MTDSPKGKPKDPTKDPTFQRVVQHFLKTPHKPHGPIEQFVVGQNDPTRWARIAAVANGAKVGGTLPEAERRARELVAASPSEKAFMEFAKRADTKAYACPECHWVMLLGPADTVCAMCGAYRRQADGIAPHWLAAKMAEPTHRQARPCPECGTRYSLKMLPARWTCDVCGANGDRGLPKMAEPTIDGGTIGSHSSQGMISSEDPPLCAGSHRWLYTLSGDQVCAVCSCIAPRLNPHIQIDTCPEPTEREKALHRAVQIMRRDDGDGDPMNEVRRQLA